MTSDAHSVCPTEVEGEAAAPGSDDQSTRRAIAAAQAGNKEALHFLYVSYSGDVLRHVKRVVKDHHEAEDITQNVFLKLNTSIRKYEPRDVPFVAWILRVARNAAFDHLRTRRMIPFEEIRVADQDHARIGRERRHDLRTALSQLPGDQREVLVLRHIVGLSPVEIAEALGKTESSVHGLHHRGRLRLRTALEDLGAAPVVAGT
ncbi:MAG TPA: sigma-70 family RNA polymerase sigma factor [Solirubrobacterales bacterium]|nr:sigma-70 family RNA polymerase sigma factor [Solirubrobacterales bacterium]